MPLQRRDQPRRRDNSAAARRPSPGLRAKAREGKERRAQAALRRYLENGESALFEPIFERADRVGDINLLRQMIETQAKEIRGDIWKELYGAVWQQVAVVATIVGMVSVGANALATWLLSSQ